MSNDNNEIKEYGNKERVSQRSHTNYRKRKSNINIPRVAVCVIGVIVVVAIIVLLISKCGTGDSSKKENDGNNKEVSQDKETTKSNQDESTAGENTEPQLVPLATDGEVYKLVMSYIDAAYVKCDATLLEKVVDSMENVDVEKNSVRQRYIEAYNNVCVYMLDGKENINVIFVTYEAKLYNYETLLPSGEMLKVKKTEEGKYMIHNIEVGEQFEMHMSNAKQVEEMEVLQEKIQSEYNAVIESNSEIKSIVDILNGAKIE